MTSPSRVLRVVALPILLLAAIVPAIAQVAVPPVAQPAPQPTAQPAIPAFTGPRPQYARPDDPWIFRGTDIPHDPQWLFGELPNGLRYAVRRAGVPPGQVSIRVRIDAGSLYETDAERGYAHLLEHMTFRQSKYLGDGEAITHFQRLGAGFGNDTNASTEPTQTVYRLDLPNATPAKLDDSVKLISGMIREPALSAANLAADRPIVLAEARESAGVDQRINDVMFGVLFEGQQLATRVPIGTTATLQKATPRSVRAFHDRWYRPERAVVVLVGDADPLMMAVLVERYFSDWQGKGPAARDPDFGKPVAPAGADPANPVGTTKVIVEPGQARNFTYAYVRPWQGVVDNLEYNRGLLLDTIAINVINRRLEARARSGGAYLVGKVDRDKPSRSLDVTYVSFAPLSADWRAGLADVRAVIGDALETPPSQAEIDREVAEADISFVAGVEQSRSRASAAMADDIVEAVNIREAVASPETFLAVFRGMRARFTPDEVFAHTKGLFTGVAVRGVLLTPAVGEGDAAAVRQALLAAPDTSLASRSAAAQVNFADLPKIGEPKEPVSQGPVQIFTRDDVEQLNYANGVRALLRRTENEPGRVTVRVRFGAGQRAFDDNEVVYAGLGQLALISSGEATLDQDELDSLLTGRKIGFDFRIEDGVFEFEGSTRADDLADQLYLFAAKFALPRWDTQPFERARASALLRYDASDSTPSDVIGRDLNWLLGSQAPRYRAPNPDQLRAATPEAFREVWTRILAQGPVEVAIFGDFDPVAAKTTLDATFGALAPRTPIPPEVLARVPAFTAGGGKPLVINHRGNADQAAAIVAWPTGGGTVRLTEKRKLELLAQVFGNRLLDSLREKSGASYSPYVGSDWPLDTPDGGRVMAIVQLPPRLVPGFFEQADAIARDLAEKGPTADEIERVTEPMRQLLARVRPAHMFWLGQIEGSAFDRNRLIGLVSIERDYTETSPEEMRALAARYLLPSKAVRIEVMPPVASKR